MQKLLLFFSVLVLVLVLAALESCEPTPSFTNKQFYYNMQVTISEVGPQNSYLYVRAIADTNVYGRLDNDFLISAIDKRNYGDDHSSTLNTQLDSMYFVHKAGDTLFFKNIRKSRFFKIKPKPVATEETY